MARYYPQTQHVVPVEDVVGSAVFGEICNFTAPIPTALASFSSSSAGMPGFSLPPDGVRVPGLHPADRQFHRTASTGFERFAVFTQHLPNMWCSSGTDSGT